MIGMTHHIIICPMIFFFFFLLGKTDRGSYDRAENGMLCCNRFTDQPIFLVFLRRLGWGERQAKVKHKTALIDLPWAEIERRSCRSFRASFIWMVLFFWGGFRAYFSFRLPQGYKMTDKSDFSPSKWSDQ